MGRVSFRTELYQNQVALDSERPIPHLCSLYLQSSVLPLVTSIVQRSVVRMMNPMAQKLVLN